MGFTAPKTDFTNHLVAPDTDAPDTLFDTVSVGRTTVSVALSRGKRSPKGFNGGYRVVKVFFGQETFPMLREDLVFNLPGIEWHYLYIPVKLADDERESLHTFIGMVSDGALQAVIPLSQWAKVPYPITVVNGVVEVVDGLSDKDLAIVQKKLQSYGDRLPFAVDLIEVQAPTKNWTHAGTAPNPPKKPGKYAAPSELEPPANPVVALPLPTANVAPAGKTWTDRADKGMASGDAGQVRNCKYGLYRARAAGGLTATFDLRPFKGKPVFWFVESSLKGLNGASGFIPLEAVMMDDTRYREIFREQSLMRAILREWLGLHTASMVDRKAA